MSKSCTNLMVLNNQTTASNSMCDKFWIFDTVLTFKHIQLLEMSNIRRYKAKTKVNKLAVTHKNWIDLRKHGSTNYVVSNA